MTDIISAFSADQVTRITGLTMGQLAYWDRTGFFEPQYAAEERRSPYSRIYSFKDVVGLRTLRVLKGQYGVTLPHLREVAKKLSSYSKSPWAEITLKVWNRQVQFDEPETGQTRGVVDGQYIFLPIVSVMEDVKREAGLLKGRSSSQIGKIEQKRFVSHNSPVIAGTRIAVSSILHFVEDGFSIEQILEEYPNLTEADIRAAIQMGKDGVAA